MLRCARILAVTLVTASGLMNGGCLSFDETAGDQQGVEPIRSPIQGGSLETGFPMVGMLQFIKPDGTESICTGSLVSQSWVLTAAHCGGTAMRFRTGTNWNDFVDHNVDQQIKHPTLDMALYHLADPIEGVPPLKVNTGAAPAVGTVCSIVGFGVNGPPATAVNGIKRSATARVTFSGPADIVATWETGITDGGDSGGPLLCNGTIGALARSHEDGDFPLHQKSTFTPVDLAWINSTIAPLYTELTLQNGWSNSLLARNASAAIVSGKVQMKGAIVTQGTNAVPFTLPVAFRPATDVIVPVDLCFGQKGSLLIKPTGVTTVRASGAWSDAQCLTSLEGVNYAPASQGYASLFLVNGWTASPNGTASPGIRDIGGIVHLRGAMASGTNASPFTIPAAYRPPNTVSAPVTLCNGKVGRLVITTAGAATIETEGGTLSDAQCMTSLEGVTYARSIGAFTSLNLQDLWIRAGNGAGLPEVEILNGIVRMRGAMSTAGTGMSAIYLGAAYRPPVPVYVPVALCSGKKGRLEILPSGWVNVFGQGNLADAQCVSLEGVSFVVSDFTPITLDNYWQNSPFATSRAAFKVSQGVVQLRGAVASSATSIDVFTLPVEARPSAEVYLPVTLCDAAKGRLHISTAGLATVTADGPFSKAQCMVSLDGLSYPVSTSGFTALTLTNGWANAPYATRSAVGKDINGTVHLAGAIASGTDAGIFQLPAALRPSSGVYVTTDLCDGRKGRLLITPDGATSVWAAGSFSDATCFTSLEGVTFVRNSAAATTMTLTNGWVGSPFSTRPPAAHNDKGIIRLQGAMASGQQLPAFTLPLEMRPKRRVYVTADLCGGARGRLFIETDGTVRVSNATGTFATTAGCFTSLEGAWFPMGN